MFILYFTSRGLEFWSVNQTSIYENFGSKVFKIIRFLDEKSNNWPNDLFGIILYKTTESCW